ncbi:hypothetical protein [Sphingobium aquiterrae]|uniref:hypothetical protein n=1 Tax=Sphingobium aquiterrae TaxID=2038656 RepID=UPI0030182ED5
MQSSPAFKMTAVASAAVLAARFVGMFTGAHCAAGAKAQGIANYPAAVDEAFAVTVLGTEVVESGGAYAAGVALKSDATGRAIAQAGAGEIVAWSRTAVAAAGVMNEVLLAL